MPKGWEILRAIRLDCKKMECYKDITAGSQPCWHIKAMAFILLEVNNA